MIESPRRVGAKTGSPQGREEQRQALITHNIPVERTDGGETYRYRLNCPLVDVKFDYESDGTTPYVAGSAKAVRVKLGHTPTGFHWHVKDIGTLANPVDWGIMVVPMNTSQWTPSQIQVACNKAGAAGVSVTLEIF